MVASGGNTHFEHAQNNRDDSLLDTASQLSHRVRSLESICCVQSVIRNLRSDNMPGKMYKGLRGEGRCFRQVGCGIDNVRGIEEEECQIQWGLEGYWRA